MENQNPEEEIRVKQMIDELVEKAQIEITTELAESKRGEGGFGSTGF